MHLLRSQALGTEVMDEVEHQIQGRVHDLLPDPDRGTIVGFLIRTTFFPGLLVLQTQDILSWGTRVHIRETEVMGPPEDIVRLQPFLQDHRRMVGQRIETKSGLSLGTCNDLQFNTDHFDIEWIFPRKFLRKGIPLPASDIVEVTPKAIIVKDQTPKEEKVLADDEETKQPVLDPVIAPAPGRTANV